MGSIVDAPHAFQPTRTNSNATDQAVDVAHIFSTYSYKRKQGRKDSNLDHRFWRPISYR